MSSSPLKKAQISDLFPCPECGAMELAYKVANCIMDDGFMVKRLRHLRCNACGSVFFDDEAMHHIQVERAKRRILPAA